MALSRPDPDEFRRMGMMMEMEGIAHKLSLAMLLGALSPLFDVDLVSEVNHGRLKWNEVIAVLYFGAAICE